MKATSPAMPGVSGGNVEIDPVVKISLLDIEQDLTVHRPAGIRGGPGIRIRAAGLRPVAEPFAERQDLKTAEIVVQSPGQFA